MPKTHNRTVPIRRVAVVGVATSIAFATLSTPAEAADASRYVALGDSFTSGPLIPHQTGSPAGCLRSGHNYPSLIAEDMGVDEFVDVSCAGATTDGFFAPQKTALGTNDPQLDALNADTSLVTMGIGGNDIGFADILVNCVTRGAVDPKGSPCVNEYTSEDGDQLRDRIEQLKPKLNDSFAAIAERAPSAKVTVMGYPAVLPENQGCWPKVSVAEGDISYLDGIEQELNAALSKTAEANGASYVDSYERGHDVCSAHGDRWVEGIIPTHPAAPIHPNAAGMDAMAQQAMDQLAEPTSPAA